jgi:hypothetical protein
VLQLVKLTLGWWDRETVRAFGIAEMVGPLADGVCSYSRALMTVRCPQVDELRLGPDPGLMDMKVLKALGTTRVLAWQAAPLLVTFSKLGQVCGLQVEYMLSLISEGAVFRHLV